MSTFNLLRNTRVFFTTNVNPNTGVVLGTGATDLNTFEVQILDGFSYSQNTTAEVVGLNEAGATPARGQRSFNTSLDPVDFSLSMYMRPDGAGANVTAEEAQFWNAMYAVDPIGGALPAWSEAAGSATLTLANSQVHQLQKFGLIIATDSTSYIVDNCALDTAVIDFGIDAIATIAFTGKGTTLRQVGLAIDNSSPVVITGGTSEVTSIAVDATSGTFTITVLGDTTAAIAFDATPLDIVTALELTAGVSEGDVAVTGGPGDLGGTIPYLLTWNGKFGNLVAPTTTDTLVGGGAISTVTTPTEGADMGTAKAKNTTAPFIANKLSVMTINKDIGGIGKAYNVAITGGSLTLSNNITYLVPANLGVVNQPITYFTGTRSVTGTINAYLRGGQANTAGLLADMLVDSATSVDPAFQVTLAIGGASAATRVDISMPSTVFTIPTISTEQVISTSIAFTAQGESGGSFDIAAVNEMTITYTAP